MYAYKARCWHTCPYTIIGFSATRYISLTGFTSFTPLLTRHFIKSTMEITALKTTYQSMITARMDIDDFITQLSTLMGTEKSSETNCRTRLVTGDHDNFHDYIRSGQSDKPSTIEILSQTPFLRFNLVQSSARDATMDETRRHNDDDYHEYRIRPYQQEKSNTISTSQLSAIIRRRTENQ